MHRATVNGLQDGMWFAADGHHLHKVLRFERGNVVEHKLEALFPPAHQVRARVGLCEYKLLVTITVRLFAIRDQKVQPARAKVAGNVLYDLSYAIRLGVRSLEVG